jgi:UDPglucose--hexose-1-phosphate uridylyltransferase
MNEPPGAGRRPEGGIVWEQRWHPLREEWVLPASRRSASPRSGRPGEPAADPPRRPRFDPTCPLCPGNERGGGRTPEYQGVLVLTDDTPGRAPGPSGEDDPLYRTRRCRGSLEIVCHHPDHSLSFAELSDFDALAVVETWAERSGELGRRREVNEVSILAENAAGAGPGDEHPHSRVQAGEQVRAVTERELAAAQRYQRASGGLLGQAVLEREEASPRVVVGNEHFVACVPWFARRAYEILVLPRAPATGLGDLDSERLLALATLMRDVAIRYENRGGTLTRYAIAVHQAPTTRDDVSCFPFHVEYLPDLARAEGPGHAGFRGGGGGMADTPSPDDAAAELRAVAPRPERESS